MENISYFRLTTNSPYLNPRPVVINLNQSRPVLIWPHVNLAEHGHHSQTQQHAHGFLGLCGLRCRCSVSSKAPKSPRTNMARSKIKPPRVLQRPCGKVIKWSYRGQNEDEIFNGLHREWGKYVHNWRSWQTQLLWCTQGSWCIYTWKYTHYSCANMHTACFSTNDVLR